jgi:CRP/FNR family transcriptional regulator
MFVLKTMDNRYDEIINALDSVAFKKIDERLVDYLKSKSEALQSNVLNITHQEIANELSTSREVISRLLKQLEQKGVLKLFRNKVEILSLV